MYRSISQVVLALCVLLCGTSIALSADKPTENKPDKASTPSKVIDRDSAEAKIERALRLPVDMNFHDTPLTDVVLFLKDFHNTEIQLNNRELTEAGVEVGTPITRTLKGVSLRSALNLLLDELNLTWIIRDEVLLITTPEDAECQLTTKAIDVSDLVVCRNEAGELWDDYQTLIGIIEKTAKPMTWGEVGGPGSMVGASIGTAKVLVVSQTYEVHEEIAALLSKLRKVAALNPDRKPPKRSESIHQPKPTIGASGDPAPNDRDRRHAKEAKPSK